MIVKSILKSLPFAFFQCLAICLVFFANGVPSAGAAEIRVAVGVGSYLNYVKPLEGTLKEKYGHTIKLVIEPEKATTKSLFENLIENKADFSAGIGSWAEYSKGLADLGFKDDQIKKVASRVIGMDELKVIAHPESGVKSLDWEQVKMIFSGQIKNFSAVGGKNLPIQLFAQDSLKADNAWFQNSVLKTAKMAEAKHVKDYSEMVEAMEKAPGSIGFTKTTIPHKGLSRIEIEKVIGRPLIGLTVGKPNPAVEDLFREIAAKK